MRTKEGNYNEFLLAKQRLVVKLRESFPVKPVPMSLSLSMGPWHDWEVLELFNNEPWPSIPSSRLSYNYLPLFGLTKKGVLYYLPVILMSVLDDYEDYGGNIKLTVEELLRPNNFWEVSPADLDIEQRRCICLFLDILQIFDFIDNQEWYETPGGFPVIKDLWRIQP